MLLLLLVQLANQGPRVKREVGEKGIQGLLL